MPTSQEFLSEIARIVGDDLSDGEVNLRLSWNDYHEGKAHIDRMRAMQRDLRVLKKDVSAEISNLKSHFITQKASVGTSLGAGLAGLLIGRRTVGKFNTANREDLRRSQINSVAPYESVKRTIDQILHMLDGCKAQVEASPEYQIRTPKQRPAPPATLSSFRSGDELDRFFVFVANEVKGPYTREQLHALHDAGTLTDESLACVEGSEHWFPFADLHIPPASDFGGRSELASSHEQESSNECQGRKKNYHFMGSSDSGHWIATASLRSGSAGGSVDGDHRRTWRTFRRRFCLRLRSPVARSCPRLGRSPGR
jgi:hypothetical protein